MLIQSCTLNRWDFHAQDSSYVRVTLSCMRRAVNLGNFSVSPTDWGVDSHSFWGPGKRPMRGSIAPSCRSVPVDRNGERGLRVAEMLILTMRHWKRGAKEPVCVVSACVYSGCERMVSEWGCIWKGGLSEHPYLIESEGHYHVHTTLHVERQEAKHLSLEAHWPWIDRLYDNVSERAREEAVELYTLREVDSLD